MRSGTWANVSPSDTTCVNTILAIPLSLRLLLLFFAGVMLAVEDRVFNQKDIDRTLVLEERTKLVAQKITDFLKATNRFDKTIVFCDDIDHASRMRTALANANSDLVAENDKYVMQITGDNALGKAELDQFIHPDEKYPVIVTTSELMTTGVDAQTCKLIVLDKTIQSMTKFKQIIGRGTRINEDYGKLYFTIMDFKKATELFADPDFDGDQDGTENGNTGTDSDTGSGTNPGTGGGQPRTKYVVHDVTVSVLAERVQYYSSDGRLITEP